jgi:hypothetical protein
VLAKRIERKDFMESWSWLAYISPKYKMDLAGWVLSTLLVCKEINQKKKKKKKKSLILVESLGLKMEGQKRVHYKLWHYKGKI